VVRTLAGFGVALLLLAALVWATRQEAAIECTVCMEYDGGSACRTTSGSTHEAALRGAVTSACSVLSKGVTRGLACDRTPPRSATCNDGAVGEDPSR
jgi:hypothetical protein